MDIPIEKNEWTAWKTSEQGRQFKHLLDRLCINNDTLAGLPDGNNEMINEVNKRRGSILGISEVIRLYEELGQEG